ncbi:MAG: hypothetical protein V3R43_00700 [bacterium]
MEGTIGFLDIPRLIRASLDRHEPRPVASLDVVLEADRWAREITHEAVAVAADGG